jgi:uncharacterized protein YfdQ (DUF2303 family)
VGSSKHGNDNEHVFIHDVPAAIAVGAALGDARTVPTTEELAGNGAYAVVPSGYVIRSLEEYMARPLRVRQEVVLHDADSFIAYLKDFAVSPGTRIFFEGERDSEEFVAVIDYHEDAVQANWCDHAVRYVCRRSVEFQTWMAHNRKQMTQVDFARFLEENMPDVVEPPSAELLQVALTFEAKKSVEFSSGVRLNNGQIQFVYDEVVRGAAQKGTIEIPEQFVLGISIHENGPAYRIPVRLRWRLQDGKVVFWYEVVRPHRFIDDAVKEIRERVVKDTGIAVLTGAASLG